MEVVGKLHTSPEMILHLRVKCSGSKLRAGGEVEYDGLEIDRVVENVLGCPWKLVSIVSKLVYNLPVGLTTNLYRGCHPVTKYHEYPSMLVVSLKVFLRIRGTHRIHRPEKQPCKGEKLFFSKHQTSKSKKRFVCLKSYIHEVI